MPWQRHNEETGAAKREEHIPGSSLAYTLGCSRDSLASSQTNLLPSPSMDFPYGLLRYALRRMNEEIERGNRKGMKKAHIQTASTILNCLVWLSTSFTSNFCISLGSLESWTAASGERSLFS
jgi:hypothetical protein